MMPCSLSPLCRLTTYLAHLNSCYLSLLSSLYSVCEAKQGLCFLRQNLMYWNGKCSLNIHGLCNGIVKQKGIFFSILCEPCWKVWGNCCVIGNIFLMNRAMKTMGCTDSQSQHWHWNGIEQYMQNSHHLVHKHLAFFFSFVYFFISPETFLWNKWKK